MRSFSGVWGHLAIALVAVTLAFAAWRSPDLDERNGTVRVFDRSPASLDSIEWDDGEFTVKLKRQASDWSVTTGRRGIESTITLPLHPRRGEQLLGKLAPLMALRAIGEVPADDPRMEEFALRDSTTMLRFGHGGGGEAFVVGGQAYGSEDRYIRRERDGAVFLTRRGIFKQFDKGAPALSDRRWVGIELKDVKRVSVAEADDDFEHFLPVLTETRTVLIDTSRKPNTAMTSFVEDLLRQNVQGMVAEAPEGSPLLRLEFETRQGRTHALKLWSVDANAESGVIVSDYLGGPAKVTGGNLRSVFSKYSAATKAAGQAGG